VSVQVAKGTTVRELLTQLGVPHKKVHIVFADHHAVSQDHALQGGEQLDLFSAIGGG
jgi:sulfur carrier protein ThiS